MRHEEQLKRAPCLFGGTENLRITTIRELAQAAGRNEGKSWQIYLSLNISARSSCSRIIAFRRSVSF